MCIYLLEMLNSFQTFEKKLKNENIYFSSIAADRECFQSW